MLTVKVIIVINSVKVLFKTYTLIQFDHLFLYRSTHVLQSGTCIKYDPTRVPES